MYVGAYILLTVCCQGALLCTRCSSCGMTTSITGSLSEGSGLSQYQNEARCQTLIAPTNATQITINFTVFHTEQSADVVQVYQCAGISNMLCEGAQLVRELSGYYASNQIITLSTGYALVQFTSDSSTTYAGFTGTWTSDAPSPAPVSIVFVYFFFAHLPYYAI
jgi:hypothetical protein